MADSSYERIGQAVLSDHGWSFDDRTDVDWSDTGWVPVYRRVPAAAPERCPTCGSTDRAVREPRPNWIDDEPSDDCDDAWHGGETPEPAPTTYFDPAWGSGGLAMRPDLDAYRARQARAADWAGRGYTPLSVRTVIQSDVPVLLDYIAELETRLGALSLPPQKETA